MVLFRKHWQDWCKHFSASGIAMEQEQWLSVAGFDERTQDHAERAFLLVREQSEIHRKAGVG